MFRLDDNLRQIHYKTEGPLIPEDNGKTPVLILLSNPHPHSVKQEMILSPNRIGRENPFWETMRNSGFFKHENSIDAPMMIRNRYQSPFRFFMAVLIPFPTTNPEALKHIFGVDDYMAMMCEGREKIKELIKKYNIQNVVCPSNTPQYYAVSKTPCPEKYTFVLKEEKIISSPSWFDDDVTIFLTFPTGYKKATPEEKANSLKIIFDAIHQGLKP